MKDKVSIIVPIYNKENYLEECLNSIINQTYNNLEIILINDESTDNSLKICKNYQKKDKRIIIINQKNKGESGSRNAGIKKATGKYIAFIDGDDFVDNNFIEVLHNNINNCDMASVGYTQNFKEKIEYYNSTTKLYNKQEFLSILLSNTSLRCFATKLYKTNIIKDNNILFNTDIAVGPDYLFLITYINNCKKINCDNSTFYHVVMSDNSAMRSSTQYNYRKADIINIFDIGLKIYNKNNIYGYDEYILYWCGGLFNDLSRYSNIDKEYIKKCVKPIKIRRKSILKYKYNIFYKILFILLSTFPITMYHIVHLYHKIFK